GFSVNTITDGDQDYCSVAMNCTGTFVVAWPNYGQDGSGWGVYGQRYNASGVAQGGEFRVNTTTAGDQMYSAVAIDSAGDYVITWSSNGQDGSGWGVYAPRYSPLGAALGAGFRVKTTTAGQQVYAQLPLDGSSKLIHTWD